MGILGNSAIIHLNLILIIKVKVGIMTELVPNVIGFHCNDEIRCTSFLSDPKYLIWSNEDGMWLGSGMYFWDNVGNAQYWRIGKIRKDKARKYKYTIVKAHLILTNILDLTDKTVYDKVNSLWSDLCETIGGIPKDCPIGKKLNLLYNNYMHDRIDIIKAFGYYPKTPDNGFFCIQPYERPSLSIKIKCIYSVKNVRCVVDRKACES